MPGERWSSKFGFLLATVGAAVGLGNIWRFSAVVGSNGGGAYLLPYLTAAVVCAVPMLVLELSIGATLRTDVVTAFRSVRSGYAALGWAIVGGVLLVLSYYLVLTGWVLGFFLSWAVGATTSFAAFTDSWLPVGYFVVATVATGGIVSIGVRGGIERMSRVVMPTVFVVLLGLAVYAATLPGWREGISFLVTPDASVLTDPGIWSAAFGQVFFSLSVGQGIMLTYGSYVDEGTDLRRSALLITVADVGAALVAGVVIFPIVFSHGLEPTLGTELAFTTLPSAFATMPFGRVVAVGFFGLLLLAALSSAVSLLEVGVAATTNATDLDRRGATGVLSTAVLLVGSLSALSYSPLGLSVAGVPVLDLVDESVGTFALPLSALFMAVVFVWVADEVDATAALGRLDPLVRYLLPVVLVLVTGAKAAGVARPAWRLVLDGPRDRPLALFVAGLALVGLVGLGWPRARRR